VSDPRPPNRGQYRSDHRRVDPVRRPRFTLQVLPNVLLQSKEPRRLYSSHFSAVPSLSGHCPELSPNYLTSVVSYNVCAERFYSFRPLKSLLLLSGTLDVQRYVGRPAVRRTSSGT
jgi:hypothetical protein